MNMNGLAVNELDINEMISKLSLFFGCSGSGKSLLITDCLYKLKDKIPNIIVICPSESQNKTYC